MRRQPNLSAEAHDLPASERLRIQRAIIAELDRMGATDPDFAPTAETLFKAVNARLAGAA